MSTFPVPTEPVYLDVQGITLPMMPRRFSSGSVGWYLSQKLELEGVRVQLSFSAVVVGSKPSSPADYPATQGNLRNGQEAPKKGPKGLQKGKQGKSPPSSPEAPQGPSEAI